MNAFTERINQTRNYLELLERSFAKDWASAFRAAGKSCDWKTRIVLIHPEHYSVEINDSYECPIRGPRAFSVEIGLQNRACGARIVWGYDCPFGNNHSRGLAADHLFPYSFGGPTLATNKIYLCNEHNNMKSSDLHFYPWEGPEPVWLSEVLRRVAKLKGVTT